jgi:hypothetical protein
MASLNRHSSASTGQLAGPAGVVAAVAAGVGLGDARCPPEQPAASSATKTETTANLRITD